MQGSGIHVKSIFSSRKLRHREVCPILPESKNTHSIWHLIWSFLPTTRFPPSCLYSQAWDFSTVHLLRKQSFHFSSAQIQGSTDECQGGLKCVFQVLSFPLSANKQGFLSSFSMYLMRIDRCGNKHLKLLFKTFRKYRKTEKLHFWFLFKVLHYSVSVCAKSLKITLT